PKVLLVLEKLRSKAARETLTHEEWLLIQKHGLLTGIVELSNLGVLNLLHHYLSPEAANFVDGGLGYESVIGNWNVSDAIPWFIADFSPGQGYESIVGSMFEVVEKIERALQTNDSFRCDIYRNARVTRLEQTEDSSYRVRMDKKQTPYKSKPAVPPSVIADAVFLALPRRPLESLQIAWLEEKGATGKLREWNEWLASVRGHRLAKIVQAYRYPWWRQDRSQRGTASRTFTDLPLRQVYYLDREWLEERGRYRNEAGEIAPGTTPEVGGMIVAYLDGHYTSFWRFITAVQRLHDLQGSDGLDKKQAILKEQEKRKSFGSRIREWPEPPELDNLFDKPLPWSPHDRALHLYYYRYGLYERAAAKVKHALVSLHKPAPRWAGTKVPEPVAGAYTFWDDFSDDALVGSGWHTWESGVSSAGIIEKMVCPFEEEKKKVYVCGEAYSSDQGWIEGALKSVELIMDRLGILLPDETTDVDAREDVRARAARMRDHVGLRPRPVPMKHKAPMSGNYPIQLGDGNVMVFLSGKIGFDPPAPPRNTTFDDEAREALKSLFAELEKAHAAPSDLVSVRAFLRTMDDYDTFNGIYKDALEHAGGTAPVRTAIAVHDLPFGARVEVDGIAVVKESAHNDV
ncbi:MAG TPA: RidA family protein, partial [Thermoanaerobaculia bacterium]|nr:RidA family protein [Thermoanaerobaculia bacterium]